MSSANFENGTTAKTAAGTPAGHPLLSVSDLRIAYGSREGWSEAVKGVSFEMHPGEIVAVVGESGSGKSTTAHAIIGLLHGARITGGTIQFDGQDITNANEKTLRTLRGSMIGLVPQDPGVSLNPVLRIGEQVAEVLMIHGLATRVEAASKAIEILSEVGLSQPEMRSRQYPHELSGGMRQRVLIGIALACQPRLVIADEPTSALDVTVQRRILDFLIGMTRTLGTSVLLITHDLAMASDRADRIVVMRHGAVVESGTTQEILMSPRHEYTRSLLAAAPALSKRSQQAPATATGPADSKPPAAQQPLCLELVHISKEFRRPDGGFFTAVDDLSLRIPKGSTMAIVGESGSGKTTAARIAVQFETATRGSVIFDGKEVDLGTKDARLLFRRRVQYVHQNPYASLNPRFTLVDILTEPMNAFGLGTKKERPDHAAHLLEQVALPCDFLKRKPEQLSGGQRQRVAIARALAVNPELIILDEPVSALDVLVQGQILALLQNIQKSLSLTYLFISHDLAVVNQISDSVAVMKAGKLIEMGTATEIFTNPHETYTAELIDAIPGKKAEAWTRQQLLST